MRKIQNLIFDLGNVLLKFNPGEYLAGLFEDPELVRRLHRAVFSSPEWYMLDRGVLTQEEAVARLTRQYPDLAPEIRLTFADAFSILKPIPSNVEVVRSLKKSGYRLYILSNYSGDLFERTKEKMPFLPYMDGTLFSYTCHLTKPEPEIYQHLIQKFSLTPDRCVFLDDTKANVEAAEQAGIHGIHFMGYEDGVAQLKKLGVL